MTDLELTAQATFNHTDHERAIKVLSARVELARIAETEAAAAVERYALNPNRSARAVEALARRHKAAKGRLRTCLCALAGWQDYLTKGQTTNA